MMRTKLPPEPLSSPKRTFAPFPESSAINSSSGWPLVRYCSPEPRSFATAQYWPKVTSATRPRRTSSRKESKSRNSRGRSRPRRLAMKRNAATSRIQTRSVRQRFFTPSASVLPGPGERPLHRLLPAGEEGLALRTPHGRGEGPLERPVLPHLLQVPPESHREAREVGRSQRGDLAHDRALHLRAQDIRLELEEAVVHRG